MPATPGDICHGDALVFFVNGHKVVERHAEPAMTLLSYLRENLMLTGTKLGCAEGGCGACTVMVSKVDRSSGKILHHSVNACLAPLCSVHGMAVTTVEGIGSTKTKLHPVQERLAKSHGSQCGFCTPGIVMSMYSLLRNNPLPKMADLETAFQGNLCRCTGYRPILDGFSSFTQEFQCGMGDKCCRKGGGGPTSNGIANEVVEVNQQSKFLPYDASQEPIFPSELQLFDNLDKQPAHFKGESVSWHRPVSLKDLLELKQKNPDAKIVVGNTEVGVEVKFKNMKYDTLICTTHVPELNVIEKHENGLKFGASVTLNQIDHTLKNIIDEVDDYKTRIYQAIREILRWFAGDQIRNVASIGGNLVTASPISDLNPILLAAGCKLTVASKGGQREILMDHDFFISYRKTKINPDEVLLSIDIPYTSENEYFSAYKQAHRREDDIAIVNAAFKVKLAPQSKVIENIRMCYGGMAPFTKMAVKTMEKLKGRSWDDSLASEACDLLSKEMFLPPGTPGGMESYRTTLTTSLFFKFFLTVRKQLQSKQPNLFSEHLSTKDESATHLFHREASRGVQVYEEVVEGQPKIDQIGRPLMHLSGQEHATGEAVYIDDMPPFKNELYMGIVYSTKAHAKILDVDFTEALAMPGVEGHVTHKDVPGKNLYKPDEEVFASEIVHSQGQIIAVVLADTKMHAQAAAKKVKVTYEELTPIITIEEAIAADSYHTEWEKLSIGDPEKAFDSATRIIEGEVRIGGQEHFYMETQASIAIPKGEHGEMEVYSSTQDVCDAQGHTSVVLGVPNNRIEVKVKRMGGAFGGKETQACSVSLPAAVAANKYQRPVRCMLDRDEDMVITGTRHPFLGRYKVAFKEDGTTEVIEVHMYSNAGRSMDLSQSVMEVGLMNFQCGYRFPHLLVKGRCCRTNTPSNTAFRGFGAPQAMFIMETVMNEVAAATDISPEKVMEKNILREGDKVFFNQRLRDDNLYRCWTELMEKINLEERKNEVNAFNESNRWKKRGHAVHPLKFGCGFNNAPHMMQGGALVHIYKDGSVLLTHGGTEMGQGLFTKMAQVASRVLKIPISKIHSSETSTSLVPNTSPTAGSVSSDINGPAVMNACNTLMERLEPIMHENPKGTWEDWVMTAYQQRISLSSSGFHKIPNISLNWEEQSGDPVNYFTYGATYSQVEIDCLTGDHNLLRTDIVMDIGQSLNPAIDIGQVEGAFIQGYGLFTLEEQRVSPSGFLYTKGPGAYKIPTFGDIPLEFNVSFLKNSRHQRAVYSSKALGEPPLNGGAAVFFAIKDAIKAARKESGLEGRFRLDSPATAERIRMNCKDEFTKKIPDPVPGTYKPWFVYM